MTIGNLSYWNEIIQKWQQSGCNMTEFCRQEDSRNEIAATRHMGKHSVSDVIHIAEEQGITFEQIKDKPDNEVYQMFFPEKHSIESLYEAPDYEYVHTELKKTGVTLKLLWEEYKDVCYKSKRFINCTQKF